MWMTDTGVYSEESTAGGILDFMSMTHFFVRYVKELGVISIQDAVKKVGLTPSRHFMLEGRGVLTPGNFADINVFCLDDLKIIEPEGEKQHHGSKQYGQKICPDTGYSFHGSPPILPIAHKMG